MHSSEEDRLDRLMDSMKVGIEAPVDLKGRIMAVIAVEPEASRISRWFNALLRPRTFRLTPAAGGLGLAVAVAAFVALWPGVPAAPSGSASIGSGIPTHFVLVAPTVRSVHITGDFTSWSQEGIPLLDSHGTGLWVADVALDPGVYQYVFIVDGEELRPDPRAAVQVDDGFGRMNSVVMVSRDGQT